MWDISGVGTYFVKKRYLKEFLISCFYIYLTQIDRDRSKRSIYKEWKLCNQDDHKCIVLYEETLQLSCKVVYNLSMRL